MALTFIKKSCDLSLRSRVIGINNTHEKSFLFILHLSVSSRAISRWSASHIRRCISSEPAGSIDFPRVSSRCSRLNEVTDFQWLATAANDRRVRSLSEFYIKLAFKRHQTRDYVRNSRLLSSSRKEERIL